MTTMAACFCCSTVSIRTIFIEFFGRSVEVGSALKLVAIPIMLFPGFTVENATRLFIPSLHRTLQNRILEEFKAALARGTDPWFPTLSESVTAHFWDAHSYLGFDSTNYSTCRWIARDPMAISGRVVTLEHSDAFQCYVEALPASIRTDYEKAGLIFCPADVIYRDIPSLRSSLELISTVPSIHATIALYLRALHILRAPGCEYDISHSDPDLPFSIFVSVPDSPKEGRLRLAESIIHECMHLQLTMIEAAFPLVNDHKAKLFSPWQQASRPLTGILHGLYVFTVIFEFLFVLERNGHLTSNERAHAIKRRDEISREVRQIASIFTIPGLTSAGYNLALFLFRSITL